jgi:hypothetical protein
MLPCLPRSTGTTSAPWALRSCEGYFNDGDRSGTQLAVIVNQKFAQHFWPNQDPLGKQMRIGTPEMKTPWMSVIGEVADVKLGAPDTDTMEQFYQPVDQAQADMGSAASPGNLHGDGGYIVLRSTLPAEETENALRAAVRTIDPLLPLAQVQTMEQAVASGEASRKFNTALITSFAVAAILLAVLGIYSIIAFSVAARPQEMAIRMALGSQRGRIVQLVVISGAKLAAVGCVIGVAGAAAASGLLRSMLFGVSPFDPAVIVLAAVAVVLLALGASAPLRCPHYALHPSILYKPCGRNDRDLVDSERPLVSSRTVSRPGVGCGFPQNGLFENLKSAHGAPAGNARMAKASRDTSALDSCGNAITSNIIQSSCPH